MNATGISYKSRVVHDKARLERKTRYPPHIVLCKDRLRIIAAISNLIIH